MSKGKKPTKSWIKKLDKKEHKLLFLYPFIDFVLSRTWIGKYLEKKDLPEETKGLYGHKKPEEIRRIYYSVRIAPVIMVLIICSMFSFLIFVSEINVMGSLHNKDIIRPDYGEGAKKVNLTANIEPITGKESKERYQENFTFDIGERQYSEGEIKEVFKESINYLQQSMIGNNKSRWEIHEDLVFIQQIPGTSIFVEWFPDDYSLISKEGTIQKGDIPEGGAETSVTAELTYYRKQKSHKFHLVIFEPEVTQKERIGKEIEAKVYESADSSKEKEVIKLPNYLDGYNLSWEEKKSRSSIKIMILGMVAAVIVWGLGSKELEDKQKQRRNQMLADYPDIINKFTLLLNAGMTLKQVWYSIADEYSREIQLHNNENRYAYQEIRHTAHELKLGVSESVAYEKFGRRCNLIPYLRFSSLITQNLKKGNKGLTQMLKSEAVESLRERKETVKRLGEEASTKLLVPMIMLLMVVLLIVIVPVFISL